MTHFHGKTPTLSLLSALVLMALVTGRSVRAADDIQFNTDVLDVKDRDNISLDQFSRAGYMMPGDYTFTVVVNGQALSGERTITYYQDEKDKNNSLVCLPQSVAGELGLKEKYFNRLSWWHEGSCIDLKSLDGMTANGNMADSTLNVSIPQAYMEYTSDNWDPPSRWDNGISGVIFDYNINALAGRNHSDYGDEGRFYNLSANGTTGVNAGAWRLRADWQGYLNHDAGSDSSRHLDITQVYAYRPIPYIKSRLTIGETYYNSDVFDSFRFVGGSLESDDNMLPPNLRGYAPEVTGVAKTNAKITVSQKGRVLYETQVAPGPFRIQDLSDAVTGQLNVKVEEQNGQVQTFTVNTSDIPYLTRPGTLRYKLAVGKPEGYEYHEVHGGEEQTADYADNTYADMHHTYGAPTFAGGEFSWGINSGWSLYGGGIGSRDYNALSVGVGRDLLQFGAVAFDASVARTTLPSEDVKTGSSYRLSYSKDFDEYDSQVTFAGYRFSTRDFMTMDEYLDARNHGDNTSNDKQMYTITFNKQFKEQGLSIYLNYSHETYWDSPKNNNFNLSLSKTFDAFGLHNLSTSLTAYKNQYNGMNDFGTYLSLSLPVGDNSTVSLNSSVGNSNRSNEVSYFHTIDANNNYELAAGGSEGHATSRAYFSHLGDRAEVDANANYSAGISSSVGLTVRGGLTATTKGMALHRVSQMGGTRMMVDTDGVAGVPVEGFGGLSRTNFFGKAVVADVNSYYRSSASIDLDKLSDTVDVSNPVVQGTLTEGAIGYRKFAVISGEKAMASLRLQDGSAPPFGATVFNDNGLQTGIVNDDGSVYLSGIQPNGKMTVKWDGQLCDIALPEKLPDLSSSLLLPCLHLRAEEAQADKPAAP